MRVLLVVNSSASSVTARRQVVIRRMLADHHDVEVAETNRRGHATKLALDAARSGTDVIVTLGGDGTLNEVANGLVGTECALAALPGGSTNVFSRAIGLSDDPIDAAEATLAALDAGSIRRVGVGSVNGRYFLFHVGIGWDAALVEEVERRGELKRYFGHLLFMYAGVRTFFSTYDRSRPHFSARFADGSRIDDAYFAVCLNLNPYTFVGSRPFNLAPQAGFDDGFTIATIRSMRTAPFLALIGAALGSGRRLHTNRTMDHRADQPSLVVEAYGEVPYQLDGEVPYQVDGDYLGTIDRLELVHHPDAMRLVVPLPRTT
jgi:diacylglycerol kinase family enzyme